MSIGNRGQVLTNEKSVLLLFASVAAIAIFGVIGKWRYPPLDDVACTKTLNALVCKRLALCR